jgi:hypothetical protein
MNSCAVSDMVHNFGTGELVTRLTNKWDDPREVSELESLRSSRFPMLLDRTASMTLTLGIPLGS